MLRQELMGLHMGEAQIPRGVDLKGALAEILYITHLGDGPRVAATEVTEGSRQRPSPLGMLEHLFLGHISQLRSEQVEQEDLELIIQEAVVIQVRVGIMVRLEYRILS